MGPKQLIPSYYSFYKTTGYCMSRKFTVSSRLWPTSLRRSSVSCYLRLPSLGDRRGGATLLASTLPPLWSCSVSRLHGHFTLPELQHCLPEPLGSLLFFLYAIHTSAPPQPLAWFPDRMSATACSEKVRSTAYSCYFMLPLLLSIPRVI